MTKDDLKFLKELQFELLHQEPEGQAEPRFWGIMETKERITQESLADREYIVDFTDGEAEKYTVGDYIEKIKSIFENEPQKDDVVKNFNMLDKDDINSVVEFSNNMLKRKARILYTEEIHELSDQTGCFLTKRAAQKHIELNGYHYSKPHTYAMTAWRNPEFERFIKIFETMELDKLEDMTND